MNGDITLAALCHCQRLHLYHRAHLDPIQQPPNPTLVCFASLYLLHLVIFHRHISIYIFHNQLHHIHIPLYHRARSDPIQQQSTVMLLCFLLLVFSIAASTCFRRICTDEPHHLISDLIVKHNAFTYSFHISIANNSTMWNKKPSEFLPSQPYPL